MKTFSVRISIKAENESDAHERLQDCDLVDNYIDQSLEEIEDE